jgi:ABC-type Mn2+/Zn2+ transport system permease subunit
MDTVIIERLSFLTSPLFAQALAAALLGGLLCGLIGPYLLWRRLSMFASSVSHAALTPLAVANVVGWPASVVLYPFSLLLALGITRAEERGVFESDSVLSLFFAGFMAVGVLILMASGTGSSEAVHYLFGDVLLIQMRDLALLIAVVAAVGYYVSAHRRELVLLCLNRDIALSEGIPVRRHVYILNLLAALTVVCLLAVMGIILTTSLIVGPALIASTFSKNLKVMFFSSALLGVLNAGIGLALAVLLDWSSGPTIAVLTLLGFLAALAASRKSE